MLTMIGVVTICYHTKLVNIIDFVLYAVLFIAMTYSFYNWKFIPLNLLYLFHPSTPSPPTCKLPSVLCMFKSVSVHFVCLDCTYKLNHVIFVFFCLNISQSRVSSRSTHVVMNGITLLFLWLSNISLCIYITSPLSIHINRHLGWFHILTIVNNATRRYRLLFELVFFFSLGKYSEVELLECVVFLLLIIWRLYIWIPQLLQFTVPPAVHRVLLFTS